LPSEGQVSDGARIQLCGRLSVEIDGVQVADALRGRQVPLLLAYLVLNRGRYVGREELIGALWPFQPPRSGAPQHRRSWPAPRVSGPVARAPQA
jgi:DNA-binding response OmpR family regulator